VRGKGGRAYVVGGGVRDHLRGLPTHDWDIEVFGLPLEDLERVLKASGAVHAVGRAFGVYKWKPHGTRGLTLDVSIPRRDSKVGPGHKGIAVDGDPLKDLGLFQDQGKHLSAIMKAGVFHKNELN
jgi:tRNA nucleotidyltransferase (CCA-adding enzyme)